MSKKTDTSVKPTFETSLSELETTVLQLEAGELPLEESLALFERGVAALKQCHAVLDQAEKRIQILVKGARGEPELEDAAKLETADLTPSDRTSSETTTDNPPVRKKSVKQSLDSAGGTRQNTQTKSSQSDEESGLW